jgi:transglutaminase-like putative cysteine protease
VIPAALGRLVMWSVHRIGVSTLVGFCLLATLLSSVAAGMSHLVSRKGDLWLLLITLLGALVGWQLARSHRTGRQASLLTLLFGLILALVGAGKIAEPLWTWLRVTISLGAATLHWRPGNPPPDVSPFLLSLQDLGLRLSALAQSVLVWCSGFIRGAPPYDPLSATLIWGLLLWGAATWAAWAVRRRAQPLAGILPAAALLAASLAFARQEALWLYPVLATALGLLGWNSASRLSQGWQARNIDTAEDIPFDLSTWMLAFIMAATMLSLMASYFSPQKTVRLAQRLIQPRSAAISQLGESLGLPQGDQERDALENGSMPRQHLLTGGPDLRKRIALVVQVSDTSSKGSYYLRDVTYDIYTGRGWLSSPIQEQEYPAGKEITPSGETHAYHWLEQYVHLSGTTANQIFVAGELISLDQRSRVEWRSPPPQADALDARLVGWPRSHSYHAVSRMTVTSDAELRGASQDYPAWVVERYLQLPDKLPARVRAVAQTLSGQARTPYDKARAIEAYLRTFPYTLDVPQPPRGRDAADFFIFDLRRGYCDYYATTFVVLARAAGLPARLVVGYVSGSYDTTTQSYLITEDMAHSWPEVYFPSIGWVEFEPTSSHPLLEQEQPAALAAEHASPLPPPPAGLSLPSWTPYLAGLILLAAFAGLGWGWVQARAWRQLDEPAALGALYRRIRAHGRILGLPATIAETPNEFAAAFTDRLDRLSERTHRHVILKEAIDRVQHLVSLYTRTIYSPHPLGAEGREEAWRAWRWLRPRLWLAWLLKNLYRS